MPTRQHWLALPRCLSPVLLQARDTGSVLSWALLSAEDHYSKPRLRDRTCLSLSSQPWKCAPGPCCTLGIVSPPPFSDSISTRDPTLSAFVEVFVFSQQPPRPKAARHALVTVTGTAVLTACDALWAEVSLHPVIWKMHLTDVEGEAVGRGKELKGEDLYECREGRG